jgi:hypothetical protein
VLRCVRDQQHKPFGVCCPPPSSCLLRSAFLTSVVLAFPLAASAFCFAANRATCAGPAAGGR